MRVIAEYIFIDALGATRSKTKVFECAQNNITLECFSEWNADGSSCGMSEGKKSDIVIRPVAFFKDPFRQTWPNVECYLVLCDTYDMNNRAHISNNRFECMQICARTKDQEPWFGIEQEYILYELTDSGVKPYGWKNLDTPSAKFPHQEHPEVKSSAVCSEILASAPSYCGNGGDRVFGREIVEKHLQHCLFAEINIVGINAEVIPGQWEFQLFAESGTKIGDELWVARYILSRVAEEYGAFIELHPKPLGNEWNGSGAHLNFSIRTMRNENGLEEIIKACERMEPVKMRELHLAAYGNEANKLRLSGKCETARFDEFTWAVADRGTSVRIPYSSQGPQYAEDRRPSAICDPYKVITRMLKTICLNEKN